MGTNTSGDSLEHKGFWDKVKDRFLSELEDESEEDSSIDPRRGTIVRLSSTRVNHVAVRTPQSLDDARLAADGLKQGHQQIINLENTPPAICERIIDFLNGATYALNGFAERVGERVYLFAPTNVIIEVPEDLPRQSTGGESTGR